MENFPGGTGENKENSQSITSGFEPEFSNWSLGFYCFSHLLCRRAMSRSSFAHTHIQGIQYHVESKRTWITANILRFKASTSDDVMCKSPVNWTGRTTYCRWKVSCNNTQQKGDCSTLDDVTTIMRRNLKIRNKYEWLHATATKPCFISFLR